MKMIVIILTMGLMQVSAASFAQRLTYVSKNASLKTIFNEIVKQTGYEVIYSNQILDDTRKVNVDFKNVALEEVLVDLLKGRELEYEIEDKVISIQRKEKSLVENLVARFQNIDVRGKVVAQDGKELPGATISVKGGKQTTTSGNNGDFVLRGVEQGAVLLISYIGYKTEEIKAGESVGRIVLEINDNPLDEVQVIAYGTTTRRLSTSNTATVKADVIEKQAGITNPLLALQGRVPGMVVNQNTGVRGGGITVRIQGQNSYRSGNSPLYIVDGVPIESFLPRMPGLGLLGNSGVEYNGISDENQSNPLSYINPLDIESIDVLKDADATAIYGSRAANGAVLITTKKGKVGKMQITVNMNSSWSKAIGSNFEMLNTRQYLDMRYEAFKNDGIDWRAPSVNAPDLKLWDTTRYTNWREKLLGGTAFAKQMQATVTGGSTTMQYRFSGTFDKSGSIFPDSGNGNPIASVNANLTSVSPNQRFRMTWSANYQYNRNEMPGSSNFVQAAWLLPPNAPEPFNSDGTLNWAPDANGNSSFLGNPFIGIANISTDTRTNLVTNLNLGYRVFNSIKFAANLGYTNMIADTFFPIVTSSIRPENRSTVKNQANYGDFNSRSWIIEPQLTYEKESKFGKFDFLLGSTFRESESRVKDLFGTNYASDALLDNIGSASTLVTNSSDYKQYKYLAYYGRLNYNLGDQFILNLNSRRDGSSRFGKNNQFSNFWSVGGAWIFSQQIFIKKSLPWLSFGKVRTSYGITGNDQIGDFQFIRTYFNYNLQVPYQGIPALQSTTLPNPELVWERVKKFSVGLDLGILNDRFLFSVNYAQNHSNNQLAFENLSTVTGAIQMLRNKNGVVIRNSTWEFSLSTVNIKNTNFSWSSNFNLSLAKNKLIAYPNLAKSPDASTLIIGQPIDLRSIIRFGGVNSATGEYQYLDKNGNPKNFEGLVFPEDYLYRSFSPNVYGGIQNSLRWKKLSLDFFVQFTKKWGLSSEYYNGSGQNTPGVFEINGSLGNQPVTVLNRWMMPGDQRKIGKVSSIPFNSTYLISVSDVVNKDASFARLKNLSLSLQLPTVWINKLGLQSARIQATGQNLVTLTGFNGPDPETNGLTSVPPLKVYALGLNVIF